MANNLSHYHIGSTILICPKDKTGKLKKGPVIEVTIIARSQGRSGQPARLKVESDKPLDIFGDKHKGAEGSWIIRNETAWLSPADWEVVGKVNKPKEVEK